MAICTENNCRKPAQSAGLCLRHWYHKKEQERAAWRTDPTLCYQCGQKRDDNRKACSDCRAKENRRRKKQREEQRDERRATANPKVRAQIRQSQMQSVRDAERTLDELRSFKLPKPSAAAAPDPANLLSAFAAALDPSQQEQDPPQDSGPQPWDRRPSESPQANRAFLVYLYLGLDRSLQKAYRSFKGSDSAKLPGRWRTWCVDHEWVARAAAYDRHHNLRRMEKALQAESAAIEERRRELNKDRAIRRAAASDAGRRAYRQNQRRWHDEGRLCRGRTRTGRPCKRPAVPGEHFCYTHTSQARQNLARGLTLYFKAGLHPTDEDFLQLDVNQTPMPQRTPPDAAALLWLPLAKDDLPARLLYADDCPATLRSVIRVNAQDFTKAAGLRFQIEPPRRHLQNQ